MNELISKNKDIQEDCKKIDEKVNEGKIFAGQIDERLDNLLDPTIPEVQEKYDIKNALIDQCDELFDQVEAKIKDAEAEICDQLAKNDEIIAKLERASPIENPSVNSDNAEFVKAISNYTNDAHANRNALEKMQAKLSDAKDKLVNDIQPLNEISEREVKQPEIEKILMNLGNTNVELDGISEGLIPTRGDVDQLDIDVDKLIADAKNKQIEQAAALLDELNAQLDDLDKVKNNATEKLEEYKALIKDAK